MSMRQPGRKVKMNFNFAQRERKIADSEIMSNNEDLNEAMEEQKEVAAQRAVSLWMNRPPQFPYVAS